MTTCVVWGVKDSQNLQLNMLLLVDAGATVVVVRSASVAPVADDADVTVSGEATVHVSGSCDPDNFVRINGTSRIPASYDH